MSAGNGTKSPEYLAGIRAKRLDPEVRDRVKAFVVAQLRGTTDRSVVYRAKLFEEVTAQFGVSMSEINFYQVYWRHAELTVDKEKGTHIQFPIDVQVRAGRRTAKRPISEANTVGRVIISSPLGSFEATPAPDGWEVAFRVRCPRDIALSLQGQAFAILCPDDTK